MVIARARSLFNLPARVDGIVVFFYSAYAIQSARQHFIIPLDAQIWTEADIRREGIEY